MEAISVKLGQDWPNGVVLYQERKDVAEFRGIIEKNFSRLPPAAHQAFENLYLKGTDGRTGHYMLLKNGDWAIVIFKCVDPPLGILVHELVHFGYGMAQHRGIKDIEREEFIASITQAVFNHLLPNFMVL
jgi:hypothetical protein